jgi:general secretion pathway protein G
MLQNVNIKHRRNRRAMAQAVRGGFTLVEILIVVVILSIIAAIVIPRMSNASMEARENMLRDDLRFLRSQIALYRAQHHDRAPGAVLGSGSPTGVTFVAQMTTYSDDSGNTSAVQTPAYPFGPYLLAIPRSPLNEKSDVLLSTGGTLPSVDDTTGWIYDPTMPEIIANQSGDDMGGVPYATY